MVKIINKSLFSVFILCIFSNYTKAQVLDRKLENAEFVASNNELIEKQFDRDLFENLEDVKNLSFTAIEFKDSKKTLKRFNNNGNVSWQIGLNPNKIHDVQNQSTGKVSVLWEWDNSSILTSSIIDSVGNVLQTGNEYYRLSGDDEVVYRTAENYGIIDRNNFKVEYFDSDMMIQSIYLNEILEIKDDPNIRYGISLNFVSKDYVAVLLNENDYSAKYLDYGFTLKRSKLYLIKIETQENVYDFDLKPVPTEKARDSDIVNNVSMRGERMMLKNGILAFLVTSIKGGARIITYDIQNKVERIDSNTRGLTQFTLTNNQPFLVKVFRNDREKNNYLVTNLTNGNVLFDFTYDRKISNSVFIAEDRIEIVFSDRKNNLGSRESVSFLSSGRVEKKAFGWFHRPFIGFINTMEKTYQISN